MKIWSSDDLTLALGIETKASGNIVHFNSSDLSEGDIFIALGSGHNYIMHAYKMGASCIITEQEVPDVPKAKMIIVPNSEDALEKMANFKRKNSKAKFIGVTGSAGKTSTKEIIYDILKHFGDSFVSRGNFNNHLGVRLNLASMPKNLDYAIFEMGMNNPGEIKPLASMIRPDIGIITNILDAHLGHFNSALEIAKEKSDIFSMMDKNGIAILNIDNPYYNDCCKYSNLTNIYSFGKNTAADSILKEYSSDGYNADLEISILGESVRLNTKITGIHHAYNISAILLLIKILGIDIQETIPYFLDMGLLKGRGQKINTTISGHDCIIINDSYNASPSAMQHSLLTLKEINHPYKIAILGDMKELGKNAIDYHKALAPFVIESGVKCLYSVGDLMHHLHEIIKNQIDTQHFDSHLELQNNISSLITKPTMILVKGSKSMHLMDLVDFLTLKKD